MNVEIIRTLKPSDDIAAVILRSSEARRASQHEIENLTHAIQQQLGRDTLLIILGPNEDMEFLDEDEMEKRGWVKALSPSPAQTAVKKADFFHIPTSKEEAEEIQAAIHLP